MCKYRLYYIITARDIIEGTMASQTDTQTHLD
jgi:hypothetical protein